MINKPPTSYLARQTASTIEQVVREEWGRLLASLISQLGDFQLAEDALQDALESALQHWQRNGLPRSPAGWLLQTARRKAIDRLRRNANFNSKANQIAYEAKLNTLTQLDTEEMAMQTAPQIADERLRLIFTCCHPALDAKSRTALTLHTLGGLTTEEIAQAFLDKKATMAQRLVRAKRKIATAGIPYSVPKPAQWNERLQTVLGVLYLIFNEGYFSAQGNRQQRTNLSDEALRLAKILVDLQPNEPESQGLLALMLLHDSRRQARQDAKGNMIALNKQNRDLWNQIQIQKGIDILETALRQKQPGPYQIQAAISAIHAKALSHDSTNWHEIAHLYAELMKLQPNPVIELNRIVALSYADTPKKALSLLNILETKLTDYQPFHAAKADLHHRLNQIKQAETAYLRAIDLTSEEQTRVFLQQKLGQMLRDN